MLVKKQVKKHSQQVIRPLTKGYRRLPLFAQIGSVSALIVLSFIATYAFIFTQSYTLNPNKTKLLSKVSVDTKYIKEDSNSVSYNRTNEAPKTNTSVVLAGTKEDSTGKQPFQATITKTGAKAVTFSDSKGDLGFSMTPNFNTSSGELRKGRVIYPNGFGVTDVYTFKRNGLKEDILLSSAPSGGKLSRSWTLDLGTKLVAKMMSNGSVGIYSADPVLFGEFQSTDEKSQKLIENAKAKGEKNYLTFVIPAPNITDSLGKITYSDSKYALAGNTLSLLVDNLKNKKYPLSIDPSVIVTTNSDFGQGSDDGMITYPGAGNIARGNISGGTLGAFNSSTSLATARSEQATVAYNGFVYVIGGTHTVSDTACNGTASNLCSDVQYAALNPDGTIGTWAATTNFATARKSHTSVVYNGFLYVIGGDHTTSDTACSGTANNYCSDVQYAPIAANGTVGTWTPTTSFGTARSGHSSEVYNGFLYVVGGIHVASDTACNGTADLRCSDIQYSPLNADGTVGTWSTTTSITVARNKHTAVAYNGFLYVLGGLHTASDSACSTTDVRCSDVRYAPINSSGTIGTWTATTSFTTARSNHYTVVSKGYLYIMGGFHTTASTACNGVSSNYCSDVQTSPVNANGTIGAWTATTSFTNARSDLTGIESNGNLYLFAGVGASTYGDVQFAQILTPSGGVGGLADTFLTATGLTIPRSNFATAAYNGYLYVSGGIHNTSDTACNSVASLYCSDVLYAAINADGTIGIWSAAASLPSIRDGHTMLAVNGFLYALGGFQGAGAYLNEVQYAPIASNGTIGSWTATTTFAVPRQGHSSVNFNGYMYILGGDHAASDSLCNGTASTFCSDVQSALICTLGNSGSGGCTGTPGTVGTWNLTTSFATARRGLAAVVYNGFMYVVGGQGAAYQNDIQYSTIGATGTVGAWASAGTAFTNIRAFHTSVVANGYLYVMSGWNGTTYYNDTQYALLNAAGTIGAWTTSTNTFATPRYSHGSVFYNGNVYIIGGLHATSDTLCSVAANTYCSNVQYSNLKPGQQNIGTTGTFITSTAFPSVRSGLDMAAYNGYLYVIGGDHITSNTTCVDTGIANVACNDVYYAAINADGSLGTWTLNGYFPVPRLRHNIVAYNDFMYVIGGVSPASACTSSNAATNCQDVQFAPINSNGTIGAWAATTVMPNNRQQFSAAAYNGYLYVTGGYNSDAATAAKSCIGGTTAVNQVCSDTIYALQCTSTNSGSGGCTGTAGTVGTWVRSANLFATARNNLAATIYNGYIYISGGYSAASAILSDIQYALICTGSNSGVGGCSSTAGDIGTWSSAGSLLGVRKGHVMTALNGYMYSIGGCTTGSCTAFINAVEYAKINANGSVATFVATSTFTTAKWLHAAATYNGNVYVVGGCTAGNCTAAVSEVQYAPFNSIALKSHYEKIVDIGGAVSSIDSIQLNGDVKCKNQISYSMAGSNGVFGTINSLAQVVSGTLYTLTSTANSRYLKLAITINDSSCGNQSYISDITVNFTVVPSVPTLVTPSSAFIGAPLLPVFQLRSSHPLSNYLRYKIDVCTTSNCSSILRTIDETASQTGWSGQDAQTSTAYNSSPTLASSTIANHTYQAAALTASTQYWWRAYTIDPLGSNAFTAASAISTFTTNSTPAVPTLNGATSSVSPQFNLRTTDPDSDYLRYKIILYQSDCTTVISTIDQTASQTGWSGQDQQSNTAYTSSPTISSSTVASYNYPGTLSNNTVYCWKAAAIDPAGLNTFTAFSGTQTFTTAAALSSPTVIGGGTTFMGGTRIGN